MLCRRASDLIPTRLGVWICCITVLVTALASPAFANTVTGPREKVRFDYTTTRVAAGAGLIFNASIRNPANPDAAPVPLRRIVLVAPRGTRLRRDPADACTASDMQFEAGGENACPVKSKVATGTTVTRPLGGLPFTSAVAVFNTPVGQAMLIKFGNGGSAVVRTVIKGRISTTVVPTCLTGGQPPAGCPFDQDAVVSSSLRFPRTTASGKPYLKTPPRCPSSKHWQTTVAYEYADGVTDRLTTSQPCSRRPRPSGRRRRRHRHHRHRHPARRQKPSED